MKTRLLLIRRMGRITVAAGALLYSGLSALPAARAADQDADRPAQPQFVFVQGQVNVPQRYVYTNGLTLRAAIKMAKGVTPQASPTKVSIIRTSGQELTLDRKAIEQDKAKDIQLKPGDRVFVPKK